MKTPRGDVTAIQYDVLNRRVSVIGPFADTTAFTYDALFLTRVRDAIGQTYQLGSNALGLLAVYLGWVCGRFLHGGNP